MIDIAKINQLIEQAESELKDPGLTENDRWWLYGRIATLTELKPTAKTVTVGELRKTKREAIAPSAKK